MINELYSLLMNATAEDLSAVVVADYVAPRYEPVQLPAIVSNIYYDLLGHSLQNRQYWLCQIRRIIGRHFKLDLLQFDPRTAYDLTDLQAAMMSYFSPNYSGPGKWSTSTDFWWSPDYEIKYFDVRGDDTEAVLQTQGGREISRVPKSNGLASFLLDPNREIGFTVAVQDDGIVGTLRWATRPEQTLAERHRKVIQGYGVAIRRLCTLPSSIDSDRLEKLRQVIFSPTLAEQGAGALALVLAGYLKVINGSDAV